MSSVKIVVIVVWLVFALVGCSEASETAPEPTATLETGPESPDLEVELRQ